MKRQEGVKRDGLFFVTFLWSIAVFYNAVEVETIITMSSLPSIRFSSNDVTIRMLGNRKNF